MASGFIILQDGRCFAKRWWCYDTALREVITELAHEQQGQELAVWLNSLLPTPEDGEDLGYGAWFRKSDGEIIPRHLDIRELTEVNQQLFNNAARSALLRLKENSDKSVAEDAITCISILVDMIDRAERGEPPLSLSDWTSVEPPLGRRSGPGWNNAT